MEYFNIAGNNNDEKWLIGLWQAAINLILLSSLANSATHGNKMKHKLDFIFTKFTNFTKLLFFTIPKYKFFTFTDLPACRTHA